jgi:hypothetical protein
MATPNVLVRTHYYETGSEGRGFYSSSERNDYLDYVEKGIKLNREIDYLDYAGDGEKSSGIFTAEGIMPKAEMKELRKTLRETKSCIWDCVVSFEEGYGKRNVYDWIQAKDLLTKTLPAFFRSVGLDPDNVVWYAGLHTNTDNRHIHLSFFEREPRVYDRKAKAYRYRKGKLPMARVADLKMAIEKAYLSPVEGAKRVRRLMEEGARKAATGDICRDSHSERVLLRKLYEEIPLKGDLGYESENMDRLPWGHRRAERPRPLQQRPLRRVGKAQEGDGGAGREDPADLPGPEDPKSRAVPLRPEVQEGT